MLVPCEYFVPHIPSATAILQHCSLHDDWPSIIMSIYSAHSSVVQPCCQSWVVFR